MDLYFILAIAAACIGVLITAAAANTAWQLRRLRKKRYTGAEFPREHSSGNMYSFLMRWSVFDYAVVVLFLMGMVFLIADLIAMFRERLNNPLFHFGYLMCGVIFTLISMIFMIVRLGVVLRISSHDEIKKASK